jgi:hypothetical protein
MEKYTLSNETKYIIKVCLLQINVSIETALAEEGVEDWDKGYDTMWEEVFEYAEEKL